MRTLLEEILPRNTSFDDLEVEHDFEHIGPKTMLLNARRFPPEGKFELILLAIEDVTARKRTTDAVATSEVRFRRLFEAARDGILLVDPDTRRITDGNPFMVELLGYPRDRVRRQGTLGDRTAHGRTCQPGGVPGVERMATIRYENLPLQSRTGHAERSSSSVTSIRRTATR